MSAEFRPIIVLLAAGLSRRFDGIKMLARVNYSGRSASMLQTAVAKLEPLELPVLVATGEYHKELMANKSNGVIYHYCSQAKLGLGHTINQMTQFIELEYPHSTHIMFVLADQVALSVANFQQLLTQSAQEPEQIICCDTHLGLSAPALFPKNMFGQLKALVGDKGAKGVITANMNITTAIPLETAAVDIDVPTDLTNWNENVQQQQNKNEKQEIKGEMA